MAKVGLIVDFIRRGYRWGLRQNAETDYGDTYTDYMIKYYAFHVV